MKTTKIFLCISGILMICLGILCLCYPVGALFTSAWMIGVTTLAMGISSMVFTLRTQRFLPNSGTRMLSSLIEILIGIFFLAHPVSLTAALPFVFSFWVVVESINLCIQAFDYKKVGYGAWWAMLLLGIGGVVLGIVSFNYPIASGKTLAFIIGIGIILIGIAELMTYWGIKRFENNMKPLKEAAEQIRTRIDEGVQQVKDAIEEARTTDADADEVK